LKISFKEPCHCLSCIMPFKEVSWPIWIMIRESQPFACTKKKMSRGYQERSGGYHMLEKVCSNMMV
jgi:hypothetical protein